MSLLGEAQPKASRANMEDTSVKITLLGTGNPAPSLKRMSPGYMVAVGGDVIVFDHGPGSHHRLLQTGTKATDVTHAFFTHLHYDHFLDFPRLLLTRWDRGAGHVSELKVYGPPPIRRLVERLIGPDGVFGPDIEARTKWDASLHVYRARGGQEPRRPPAPEVTELGKTDVVETSRRWRCPTPSLISRAWAFASTATKDRWSTRETRGRARRSRSSPRGATS
jgi:ribonuclease BN (tRNA processing enzyme)